MKKKININSLVQDSLSPKNNKTDSDSDDSVLSYSLKEAREKFNSWTLENYNQELTTDRIIKYNPGYYEKDG